MALLILAAAACLTGQDAAPIGIIRGDLESWSGTPKLGEFIFRNGDDRVYRCSFDQHTFFERANQRIAINAASRGDRLEVVADRQDGPATCYARTVQIIDPPTRAAVPGRRPRIRPASPTATVDWLAPRGDLTMAGVVLNISAGELLLRTRTNQRLTILLRPDTNYLGGGQQVEAANLLVNTRVFIRAGKNLDRQVEAYQVVWGEILEPVLPPER